jgi:Cupin domain
MPTLGHLHDAWDVNAFDSYRRQHWRTIYGALTIYAAGLGPPRHIHSREDEIFYILEGSYELHVGGERRTVSAGASAILPPRHSTWLSQCSVHAQPLAVRHQSQRIRGVFLGGGEMFFVSVARITGRTGAAVRSDSASARSVNWERRSVWAPRSECMCSG